MIEADPVALACAHLRIGSRVLVFGQPGSGKSRLCAGMADAHAERGGDCRVVSINPGSPAFGPPGALSCAKRQGSRWVVVDLEAICTLDAARFRLPLVMALERLVARCGRGCLIVDAAGVSRGMAAAELLQAVTKAASIDTVLLLGPQTSTLGDELAACGARIVPVVVPARASVLTKQRRAERRTELWDAHLQGSRVVDLDTEALRMVGAPPPRDSSDAWDGRLIALLDEGGSTLALGEVVERHGRVLRARLPAAGAPRALLVRDARRLASGVIGTSPAPSSFADDIQFGVSETSDLAPTFTPAGLDEPVIAHAASARVALVSGVLGDPLLHVRLRHQRRSMLFDLGDATRLQARIAHQVTDVFVSHAHVDHIAGFLWLLRTRIGVPEICSLYGPPGLAEHVAGLVGGVEWDRVGDRGPRFIVGELDGTTLSRWSLQAGGGARIALGSQPAPGGVLLDEPSLQVRAVTLDHGIPVLAFALEESRHLNVRKERLAASGLEPGPWLEALKENVHAGEVERLVLLPDESERATADLADELLIERPGEKLVYATDFADTPDNRQRLIDLARGAHTLFCEAAFTEAERDQAASTQHLTARACAEIAAAAKVGRLIPFHLSRRYDSTPEQVFCEVRAAFERTVLPPAIQERFGC